MYKYLSQINLAPDGKFSGPGKTGLLADPGNGITAFTKFVSSSIGLMTIIGIIWVIYSIIIGAVGIITSGGDKAALESSKKKITNSLIGLVVIVSALFVLSIIGQIIGLPFILDLNVLFETLI